MSAFVLIEKRLTDIEYLIVGHRDTVKIKQNELAHFCGLIYGLEKEAAELKEHLKVLVADMEKKAVKAPPPKVGDKK